jgi:2-oxo-4-hydroxy-4-carboxy-5-ureidoimidazoline decarboxylase
VDAPQVPLTDFNEWPAEQASGVLAQLLACEPWQRVLVAGRPYLTPRELAATSDGVVLALGWPDVTAALASHDDAVPPAARDTEDAAAYAQTFGVPFVIEPTGRTAEQIRAALAERRECSEEDEQRTVRRELAAIVRTRIAKTFG